MIWQEHEVNILCKYILLIKKKKEAQDFIEKLNPSSLL